MISAIKRFRWAMFPGVCLFPLLLAGPTQASPTGISTALAGLEARAAAHSEGFYAVYHVETVRNIEDGADLSGNNRFSLVAEVSQGDQIAYEVITHFGTESIERMSRRTMVACDGIEESWWWDRNEGSVTSGETSSGRSSKLGSSIRATYLMSRYFMEGSQCPRVGHHLHELLDPSNKAESGEEKDHTLKVMRAGKTTADRYAAALTLHQPEWERVTDDLYSVTLDFRNFGGPDPGYTHHFEIHDDGALRSYQWRSTTIPGRVTRQARVEEYATIQGMRLPVVYTIESCIGLTHDGECTHESKLRVRVLEMGFLPPGEIPTRFFNFRPLFPPSTKIKGDAESTSWDPNEFMEMPSLFDALHETGLSGILKEFDYSDYPEIQQEANNRMNLKPDT